MPVLVFVIVPWGQTDESKFDKLLEEEVKQVNKLCAQSVEAAQFRVINTTEIAMTSRDEFKRSTRVVARISSEYSMGYDLKMPCPAYVITVCVDIKNCN